MAEPVRFYLDEHVAAAVAEGVRRRGGDVLTVQEAGRRGAGDAEQLAYAGQTARVVVTQDTDFLRLHAVGTAHRGIVYASPQLSVGDMVLPLAAAENSAALDAHWPSPILAGVIADACTRQALSPARSCR